jgi:hypothetical protein
MEIGLLLFMVCQHSNQGLVMEHSFCDFLLLCDGEDSKLIDGGHGAWLLRGINTRGLEKLKTFVFLTLLHWIMICYKKKLMFKVWERCLSSMFVCSTS